MMPVRCLLSACVCVAMLLGCRAFRVGVSDSDMDNPVRMTTEYDSEDLRTLGQSAGQAIVAGDFVRNSKIEPVIMIWGIQNRTPEHIDTKALTDTIRSTVFESGKVKFINEVQRDALMREQNYPAANARPETRAAIGKQLGARYLLSGSLVELKKNEARQVRIAAQEEIYYQLTVEVTDIETGLIVWTKPFERARLMK